MDVKDIMHPEDAKALQMLKELKGFDDLIRWMMENGYEKHFRGENLGSMLKVSERNFPEINLLFKSVVKQVGINMPELYIYNDPVMNAYTYGETNTFVAISSGLIDKMTIDEVRCVMAHECGHILCHHTLYNTLLRTIKELGWLLQIISYSAFGPILMAMQYWHRKSELSADRAASIITSPEVVASTMARLSGGPKSLTSQIDMKEWASQADEYEKIQNNGLWNKTLQLAVIASLDHPFSAVRVREILKWGDSEKFRMIKNGGTGAVYRHTCSNCGGDVDDDWKFCLNCGNPLNT